MYVNLYAKLYIFLHIQTNVKKDDVQIHIVFLVGAKRLELSIP